MQMSWTSIALFLSLFSSFCFFWSTCFQCSIDSEQTKRKIHLYRPVTCASVWMSFECLCGDDVCLLCSWAMNAQVTSWLFLYSSGSPCILHPGGRKNGTSQRVTEMVTTTLAELKVHSTTKIQLTWNQRLNNGSLGCQRSGTQSLLDNCENAKSIDLGRAAFWFIKVWQIQRIWKKHTNDMRFKNCCFH